jgi:TrmH family RNA methyltransferase
MISKGNIKFIKSLQIKKYRKQEQCFIVEGAKSVLELLNSDFDVLMVFGTTEFLEKIKGSVKAEVHEVTSKDLQGLGEFQTNESALAVARIKPNNSVKIDRNEFALVLDDIRDPGNLGTMIRTADWYGITKLIVSEETADIYNTKVINATMGSFTRLHIYYTSLEDYLSSCKQKIMGAFLDGVDVHKYDFSGGGLIVIGNEARGISESVSKFVTDRITIPRFGGAESLNAASATAVICDNIRRH